jgi:hypothetical protein
MLCYGKRMNIKGPRESPLKNFKNIGRKINVINTRRRGDKFIGLILRHSSLLKTASEGEKSCKDS